MQHARPLLPTLILALALCGCATSRPAPEAPTRTRAEVDRALTAAYAAFSAAYRQASAPAAAALYTEDAVYLSTGMEPVRGRPAIEAVFQRFLGTYTPGTGPSIQFSVDDRRVRGDVVVDVGTFTIGAGPGATRYVAVWCHEADGAWRICTDSYHPQRRPGPPPGGG